MSKRSTKKNKLRFCFGDTETTGLAESVEECIANDRRVIEYAFAIWEEGTIRKRFERKVMPKGQALLDAEECAKQGFNHFHIDKWWTRVGTSEPAEYHPAREWNENDCGDVWDFMHGETFAGSNPKFDVMMFKAEFLRLGKLDTFPTLATHRMLDVAQLSWPLWSLSLIEKTGLETISAFLGVEHKAHEAMGDVLASIKVFELLVDQYVHKPRRLKELCEAIIPGMMPKSDQADALAELAKVPVW